MSSQTNGTSSSSEDNGKKSIAIITMSTRTPRVGPNVAAFVKSTIESHYPDQTLLKDKISLSTVDLAEYNLPVYDEQYVIPAMITGPDAPVQFAHEASRAWSAEVRRHDGYVLVIPEYNYGMAGGTKNAVDYLVHEWKGKPVCVVSYGVQGGKLASEQLTAVLAGVGLKVVGTRPKLAFVKTEEEMEVERKAGRHVPGKDTLSAGMKGELGEATKEVWGREGGEERGGVVRGFGEVVKGVLGLEGGEKEKENGVKGE